MVNGGGKHPKKTATKQTNKTTKKTAAALTRGQLTKKLPKPEKPAS